MAPLAIIIFQKHEKISPFSLPVVDAETIIFPCIPNLERFHPLLISPNARRVLLYLFPGPFFIYNLSDSRKSKPDLEV